VKFVGVGEKYDALDPFIRTAWPNAFWNGRCVVVDRRGQSKVDQSEAEEQLKKLQKNEFTLDDFARSCARSRSSALLKDHEAVAGSTAWWYGMPQLSDEQSQQMEHE